MSRHQDAYISDVMVNTEPTAEHPFNAVVDDLKKCGMTMYSIDENNCTLEGAVESSKVGAIDEMPGVKYVRTLFTYVADYPPDDHRDLDKVVICEIRIAGDGIGNRERRTFRKSKPHFVHTRPLEQHRIQPMGESQSEAA